MPRWIPPLALLLTLLLAPPLAVGHEVEPDPPPPSSAALSDVQCQNGFADVYPCWNTDLLAYVPVSALGASGANDVWGWVHDADGHEFVLLGVYEGTAFLDVSDPRHPVYLGLLPSHTGASPWRDIRTIGHYALVVSEAVGHGMQVFDLHRLEDVQGPPVVFTEDAHYAGFGDAHNISVNEATGFAYAVGATSCSRGLTMIDVSDPLVPTLAGCFSGAGYVHDVQCVVYAGPDVEHQGKEICFASDVDAVTIVDVTQKASPVVLSWSSYPGVGYVHQGWLTPDQAYFLQNDELDEQTFGHPTRTYVWDLADLDAPVLTGFYEGPTPAADHNLFVRDGHVHQALYTAGVRFQRLGDLGQAELAEVAFFDTIPSGDDPLFFGVWGVYPYLPSGIVAASDVGQGLFLLAPNLGAVPECDDGIDNDGDGLADAGTDPACLSAAYPREASACQDGMDNDGDGLRDFDGGLSILGAGHPDVTAPDPECVDRPWRNREGPGRRCGIGFELALLVPLLGAARAARRRPPAAA